MGFIDIEDALQEMLSDEQYNACAKPLPEQHELPHVVVDLVNAQVDNAAQAVYSVDFDVRAADYAGAVGLQVEIANWAMGLAGADVGGVPCYQVDDVRLQRAQPDASHQNEILATVSAILRLRVADM